MPSLQVRELPEHIYVTLCREAEAQHRSLSQQAIAVLARGLNYEIDPRIRRKSLLQTIRAENAQPDRHILPDPALLLREDRAR